MKRLRVEFGGKALDAVRIDADAPGAEGLSRCEIFQVALGHSGSGSLDFDDDFALRMVASSSANRKSRIPNARRCAAPVPRYSVGAVGTRSLRFMYAGDPTRRGFTLGDLLRR